MQKDMTTQRDMTTIEAFWKVLSSPSGEESLHREARVKLPDFSLPKIELPRLRFPGLATS